MYFPIPAMAAYLYFSVSPQKSQPRSSFAFLVAVFGWINETGFPNNNGVSVAERLIAAVYRVAENGRGDHDDDSNGDVRPDSQVGKRLWCEMSVFGRRRSGLEET